MSSFNSLLASRFVRIIGLSAADAIFFGSTDPMQLSPAMLIIGFLLAASTIYTGVKSCMIAATWYGINLTGAGRRLARSVTAFAAGLLALQSIGQLSGRDILVALPILLLAYLYVSYGRAAARP